MEQVRMIKTQGDYDLALARLSALMDEDIAPNSELENQMELLSMVINKYESEHAEPVAVDAVDAILFRMDQMNMNKKDLVPYLGSLSKVSEVLSRKRPLSLSMMRKIHSGLQIPAEVLLGKIDGGEADLAQTPDCDYRAFPWQEMLERGYVVAENVRQAKEQAEELFKRFMQGVSLGNPQPALLRAPLHQSGSKIMDENALLVWRVAVLKKARQMSAQLLATYQSGSIGGEWLRDLVKLSQFEQGPRLAQEYLFKAGIVLVIEKHFKQTYLDGAAMLDGTTPIIALTLRYDRIDNFWFALLHELAHVHLHLNPDHLFIADDLDDKTRTSLEEQQADAFAQEALIAATLWGEAAISTEHTVANALALANQLRIHPAIVAGRVRRETGNWRLLHTLKGEVRQLFTWG